MGWRRAALAVGIAVMAGGSARGEDRVTVRGVYFREASTKVVQPMVQVTKDLPNGIDVAAHGLVDAITSPSILTGVAGDDIFTEYRKEAGLMVGKTFERTRVALSYRESREPDYIARAVGFQLQQGVWENSGTLAMSLAYSTDTLGPMLTLPLKVVFSALSYTQGLSPLLLGQIGYELSYLEGYQCNPYDKGQNGTARCPWQRLRHVAVARLARYFPRSLASFQIHYRFYYDHWPAEDGSNPWGIRAHTVEARVQKDLPFGLAVRLAYRVHSQGAANFWCNEDPARGGNPGCYGIAPRYHATDEKLGALTTHIPEAKLYWEARPLARVPVLSWFAPGVFELSYARYFQITHYGDAHLLQTAYSLPF
jgi:hypothetical protein